jgi:predicted small secreted protein
MPPNNQEKSLKKKDDPMNRNASFRIVLAAGLVASLLSACNTVKGAGRDVESVGRAAERAID